jgi:hypothetical protein
LDAPGKKFMSLTTFAKSSPAEHDPSEVQKRREAAKLTIAKEFVLVSPSDDDECSLAFRRLFGSLGRSPFLPPLSLDFVQSRLYGFINQGRCKPVVVAVMQFDDPEVVLG